MTNYDQLLIYLHNSMITLITFEDSCTQSGKKVLEGLDDQTRLEAIATIERIEGACNRVEPRLGGCTNQDQAEVRDLIAQIRRRSTSIRRYFKPTN